MPLFPGIQNTSGKRGPVGREFHVWSSCFSLSLLSAATLFNCLDTDLKQNACVSPSSTIFSSRLNNFKHKLFILFLKFASNVSHLEELMCYDCRFSLYCNCIRR